MPNTLQPVTLLGQLRRERFWTFARLQEEIRNVTGHTLAIDTLRRACARSKAGGNRRELTMVAIEKFLAAQQPSRSRK